MTIGLIGVCLLAFVPVAGAQSDAPSEERLKEEKMREAMSKAPDIGQGLKISGKLCTSCHLIGDPGTAANAATPADVPSFASIANRPGQTADRLINWLMAPHLPMPDPHLSRLEIRDLAGYILSLKSQP